MIPPLNNKEKKLGQNEVSAESLKNLSQPQDAQNKLDLKTGGEVSDFMEGLDVPTPSEKVSERLSEDDKKQQGAKTGKKGDEDAGVIFPGIDPLNLPIQKVMVRQIRNELHKEIRELMRQAKIEEKKGPYYLAEVLEKIRRLQGVLKSLATATYEVIKNLYISFFEKKEKGVK